MKVILLSILAILLLGSTLYLSNKLPIQEEETINNRNFFKKWGKKAHSTNSNVLKSSIVDGEDVPQIITYGINFKIEVDNQNTSDNIDEININTKVTAQCDVQTIYDEEKNIFEVAVSYSMIDKHNLEEQIEQEEKLQQEQFETEDDYREFDEEVVGNFETIEQQNLFYIVTVGADSGEVLSLQIERSQEEDVIMTYATQQLINDIFPEMRKGSYTKGVIESDNLGEVHVDYIKTDLDEDNIAITKEFNTNDYVELEINEIDTPEVKYERISVVEKDTGLVQEGMTDYQFSIGDSNQEEIKLRSADGEETEQQLEVLGQVSGEMVSNFWIIDQTEKDEMIAREMFRYRNNAEFEYKRLAKEMKADIQYGTGEDEDLEFEDFDVETEIIEVNDDELANTDEPSVSYVSDPKYVQELPQYDGELSIKLGNGRQTFQEVKELASTKILGKKIAIDFIYTGYTQVSSVAIKAKVGNHYIANLISGTFNNCKPSSNQSHQSKKITFFKATFPILGIVVVPVSAAGVFNYGYTTSVTARTRYCAFNLAPYMSVGLYADGKVSLAGIISAGIYAQGTFLNSKLALSAVTQAGKSTTSLTGQFQGIQFEMGATYTKISCSLKNLKSAQIQEIEQEEEEQIVARRNLGLRKKFKKIKKAVKKAVHVVKPVVKQVAKVAQRAVTIATNLHKICSKSNGSVLIAKTNSRAHNKTIWNKSVNFGI